MAKCKCVRLITLLMLIIATFCLSACSSVNATTQINSDGTIDEMVTITIDDDDLTSQGYTSSDISSLKSDVQNIGVQVCANICKQFNKQVKNDILMSSTQEQIDVLKTYLNGITAFKSVSDSEFVFGIKFANASIYKYYYNISTSQTPNYSYEKHFLYTKVYYYGLTMYADYTSLYNQISAALAEDYPDIVANNKAQQTYTYETDSRREHSDADYIVQKDGKYYHTWSVDSTNLEQPVMIYYNIANSGNCILICIGITLALCAVLLLIALIIDKHKKKTSTQN